MRALKAATVIMGVLILVGTAVLIAVIVKRINAPTPEPGPEANLVPYAAPYRAQVQVPPGTRITGIASTGTLLAVSLGGAADEVVVLDPRTGQTAGTITLAPR
jgi:hypothetical protein